MAYVRSAGVYCSCSLRCGAGLARIAESAMLYNIIVGYLGCRVCAAAGLVPVLPFQRPWLSESRLQRGRG
jgi:hypothetical protein